MKSLYKTAKQEKEGKIELNITKIVQNNVQMNKNRYVLYRKVYMQDPCDNQIETIFKLIVFLFSAVLYSAAVGLFLIMLNKFVFN